MHGLLEEAEAVIEEFSEGDVRDAALVACAQAVEHYEIARYGSLVAWAKSAGQERIASLMEETLAEEKKTDAFLNQLANEDINQQAD